MMKKEASSVSLNGFQGGATYLRIPPGTTQEKWVHIATRVTRVGYGYWWWIGDLVAYAQHNFEEYRTAVQQLGAAIGAGDKYLYLMGWCASKYAVRDRVRGLSLSHHLKVATLPRGQRARLLHKAIQKRWSAEVLRTKILPKSQQTVVVLMRVPNDVIVDRRFLRELKNMKDAWGLKVWVQGTAKPGKVGPRPMPPARHGNSMLPSP